MLTVGNLFRPCHQLAEHRSMSAKLWPFVDSVIVHNILVLWKNIVNIFLIAMVDSWFSHSYFYPGPYDYAVLVKI